MDYDLICYLNRTKLLSFKLPVLNVLKLRSNSPEIVSGTVSMKYDDSVVCGTILIAKNFQYADTSIYDYAVFTNSDYLFELIKNQLSIGSNVKVDLTPIIEN